MNLPVKNKQKTKQTKKQKQNKKKTKLQKLPNKSNFDRIVLLHEKTVSRLPKKHIICTLATQLTKLQFFFFFERACPPTLTNIDCVALSTRSCSMLFFICHNVGYTKYLKSLKPS